MQLVCMLEVVAPYDLTQAGQSTRRQPAATSGKSPSSQLPSKRDNGAASASTRMPLRCTAAMLAGPCCPELPLPSSSRSSASLSRKPDLSVLSAAGIRSFLDLILTPLASTLKLPISPPPRVQLLQYLAASVSALRAFFSHHPLLGKTIQAEDRRQLTWCSLDEIGLNPRRALFFHSTAPADSFSPDKVDWSIVSLCARCCKRPLHHPLTEPLRVATSFARPNTSFPSTKSSVAVTTAPVPAAAPTQIHITPTPVCRPVCRPARLPAQ
jgi:hypothetical protein